MSMPSPVVAHVSTMRLHLFIAGVFLTGCAAQSFAANTDRAATAVERREGVAIGGGDGSSFDKAIVVHAASLTISCQLLCSQPESITDCSHVFDVVMNCVGCRLTLGRVLLLRYAE